VISWALLIYYGTFCLVDIVDNCNLMCPHVCCVYCPDPVWIPSVHACVDLSFVSSRQYNNVTHARVNSQRFALAWAVALADGGHHAGAWCSGLSPRHSYGSTDCSRSTSTTSTSNCAKHPHKDLEAEKIQREAPPAKSKIDNTFDFNSARRILIDLMAATPDVVYTITATPQERNNSETSATMMHDTVFTIAERQVFEANVPFSSGIEDDDFPFDSIDDMWAYEANPDILDPLFPDWKDKAAIELYYQKKIIQEGLGDHIIKPEDSDNEDPDFPFKDVAELRFIAENATSEDDEYTSTTSLHGTAAPTRLHVVHPTVTHPQSGQSTTL
jgi:hypothetical protein